MTFLRIYSIIGIVLTVIFMIWVFMAAESNGRIDRDEFAPVAFIYGLHMLALSILGSITGGSRKQK